MDDDNLEGDLDATAALVGAGQSLSHDILSLAEEGIEDEACTGGCAGFPDRKSSQEASFGSL